MAKLGPMSVRPVPANRLWLLVLGFGAWRSALITVMPSIVWAALSPGRRTRFAFASVWPFSPYRPSRIWLAMAQLCNDACRHGAGPDLARSCIR